jgi:hypothetical protein
VSLQNYNFQSVFRGCNFLAVVVFSEFGQESSSSLSNLSSEEVMKVVSKMATA